MQENTQGTSIIKQNMVAYLSKKGISQYQAYKETGITRGVLGQANGISEDNLLRFISVYRDISTDWLLTGNGAMLRDGDIDKTEVIHTTSKEDNDGTNDLDEVDGTYIADQEEYNKAKELGLNLIPEYSDAFKGGYRGTMISTDEISAYWAIPNVKADMVIEVEGDSMSKAYPAGSRVAVREIQFDHQYPTVGIPFGEVFGIIVDNGDENYLSYIKRLRRHPDKALQYKYWIAQSDNEAYDDFEIEISKVRHLFIVVAGVKLTRF